MTLPSWEDRPQILANLTNPAFCGKILFNCFKAYSKETGKDFPFALSYLVLPLILHKTSRETLPSTSRKMLHAWLDENNEIKITLTKRIQSFIPFSKEALMFLMCYKCISITDLGNIKALKLSSNIQSSIDTDEVLECFKKSEMVGKLFAKSGKLETIFSLIGVKP